MGEGLHEAAFLKYLRSVYSRNTDVKVKIIQAKGGFPGSVVQTAINAEGSYDKKVVMLDNDRPYNEMVAAQKLARMKNIELIENTPCLEATLLSILGFQRTFSTSDEYKDAFETRYLSRDKRCEWREYENVFSRQTLDNNGASVLNLGRLIQLMQGKW